MLNNKVRFNKKTKFKKGQKVKDGWFTEWGLGKVIKVLKTRLHIKFSRLEDVMIYDKPHYSFLKKV